MYSTMLTVRGAPTYKRVCFYTNWSYSQKGKAKFEPEAIDVSLCTHIVYAYASLQYNRLVPALDEEETRHDQKGL